MHQPQSVIDLHRALAAHHVALTGVHIEARIEGPAQRVRVRQAFVNRLETDLEAIYTFPVPPGAAVCGFEILNDERRLCGRVEAADQAEERYEAAMDRGHGAYLLEQESDDVLSLRVGRLRPGGFVVVELNYVQLVEIVDGAARLSYPTVVAPRYANHEPGVHPGDFLAQADAINPPHWLTVPYGLSFQLEADFGIPLSSVRSPSHQLHTEVDGSRLRAQLGQGDDESTQVPLDRDVVLNVALERMAEPTALVQSDANGQAHAAVSFLPKFDSDVLQAAEQAPCDVLFVVDCSGSMGGQSIQQAKRALRLCLQQLREGDRFNILRFGSTHTPMTRHALTFNEANLVAALAYVHTIDADLGGTKMGKAIRWVTNQQIDGPRRDVILLSDGQVSDDRSIVNKVGKLGGKLRFFTFGIGAAANAGLMASLAQLTKGRHEAIAYGERIEPKILRTFARLTSPQLGNVSVTWENSSGAPVEGVEPADAVGGVFDGEPLQVLARLPREGESIRRVSLQATGPDGRHHRWSVDLPAATTAAHDAGLVPVCWAHHRIQALQNAARPQREAIIDLARGYQVQCQFASFVAEEYRLDADGEAEMVSQRVPVAVPYGWHGMEELALESGRPDSRPMAPHILAERCITEAMCDAMPSPDEDAEFDPCPPSPATVAFDRVERSAESDPQPTLAEQVLGCQDADGACRRFDRLPEDEVESARARLRELGVTDPSEAVVLTFAVFGWLHREAPDEAVLLHRAARKAIRYVAQATGLDHRSVERAIRAA